MTFIRAIRARLFLTFRGRTLNYLLTLLEINVESMAEKPQARFILQGSETPELQEPRGIQAPPDK